MKIYIYLVICALAHTCCGYKPVAIIHGVWDLKTSLIFLSDTIKQAHPGTEVYTLDVLHGWKSFTPLWSQVKTFHSLLAPIMANHPEGIILIGYSQGGVIGRGILEAMDHNVKTFISLSSPQAGQYGDNFLHLIFPEMIKEKVYHLFYTRIGQTWSVANYWNDPYHQTLYFGSCNYLPVLNNELPGHFEPQYKKNFSKLEQLVLIGGPDDEVITPWQSSQFGFYKNNSEEVVNFRDGELYTRDLFGLRSLDKAGKIKVYEIAGVHHTKWHNNMTVIKTAILPWLTD